MITGTIAIMVEAMPAFVYVIETREKDTPKKGPKKAPVAIPFIAAQCLVAWTTLGQRFMKVIKIENPIIPAIIRIWVEAKGL